jgi:hypothetical protein
MAYLATSCVMIAVVADSWWVVWKCKNSSGYGCCSDLEHGLIWTSSLTRAQSAGSGAAVSKRALSCGWLAALVLTKRETGASLSYV